MSRYLMTHSLLRSWLYSMKENPFENADSVTNPWDDFMQTLRRERTEPTEAMKKGIDFENYVTSILLGNGDPNHKWFEAAQNVAKILRGAKLQFVAKREIKVADWTFLLYGKLDALLAGNIYDIKFSSGYDRGKFFDSTQHPTYLELVPEAPNFIYLVSNGSEVWTETYHREETRSILPVIEDFMTYIESVGLMNLFREKWTAL